MLKKPIFYKNIIIYYDFILIKNYALITALVERKQTITTNINLYINTNLCLLLLPFFLKKKKIHQNNLKVTADSEKTYLELKHNISSQSKFLFYNYKLKTRQFMFYKALVTTEASPAEALIPTSVSNRQKNIVPHDRTVKSKQKINLFYKNKSTVESKSNTHKNKSILDVSRKIYNKSKSFVRLPVRMNAVSLDRINAHTTTKPFLSKLSYRNLSRNKTTSVVEPLPQTTIRQLTPTNVNTTKKKTRTRLVWQQTTKTNKHLSKHTSNANTVRLDTGVHKTTKITTLSFVPPVHKRRLPAINLPINVYLYYFFMNPLIAYFISLFNKQGHKEQAEVYLYHLIIEFKNIHNINFITSLLNVIHITRPFVGVTTQQMGRRTVTRPVILSIKDQFILPIRWLFAHIKNQMVKSQALQNILTDTNNGTGVLVNKVKELHEKAYLNRNYIYFKKKKR